MKVLVPVKRVPDYNWKSRVNADGTGVDLASSWARVRPCTREIVGWAIRDHIRTEPPLAALMMTA